MAFRSEIEQVREQLRREEEKTRELIENQADLERQLLLKKRGWPLVAIFVIGAALAGLLGFTLASFDASRRMVRVEVDHQHEIEKMKTGAALRERDAHAVEGALSKCREDVVALSARECAPRRSQGQEPCRCEPGDPLCSCL